MRIERLVLEGFGPFATRQEIDFAPLDEAGLFLITGRTGSGKSTILDAICFALYGTAPRYDGAQARLRSDYAVLGQPTRVELELTVAGERWRVVRSPEYERPKQRGSGTTREAQAATLERWEAAEWVGVAARPVDVAEHLGPILQLSREQFLQVILLAQGRFQEFLKARTDERLDLLRALFGTERFQLFEREITERARALEQSVGAGSAAVRSDLGRLAALIDEPVQETADAAWAAAVAGRLSARAEDEEIRTAQARAVHAAADEAAAAAIAAADLQRRRDTARAALADLEADRSGVDARRARISAAVRVLPVLPAVDAAGRAIAEVRAAESTLERSRVALGAAVEDPAAAGAELDGLLGVLVERLQEEEQLPRMRTALAQAEASRVQAEGRLAELLEESGTIPGARTALQERRLRAEAVVAGAAAADAELTRAQAVVRAVAATEAAATAVLDAERVQHRALTDEQAAIAHTRALLAARLAGAAGLLAASLEPGAACPVCGSAEHPAPAATDATTPDERAVTAAERAQQSAADHREDAAATAAAARARHAAAAAAADGATTETAEAAVRTALAAVDAARAAVAEHDVATRLLARLDTRTAEVAAAVATTRATLEAQVAAVGAARLAVDGAAERVAAARERAPSVAERVRGLRSRRIALAATEDALRRLDSARSAEEDARDRLTTALEDAGIADVATALAAALPAAERQQLEREVRAWETARDGTIAQLADRDVSGAPDETVDVAGAVAAKTVALAARDSAADHLSAARALAAGARDIAASVAAAESAMAEDRAQLAVVGPLAEVVRGGGSNAFRMRLESYVLAARLEQIVAAANVRLSAMTDGRFTLQHDDGVAYRGARSGLGLEVLDEHTGRPRPVASLSGGETFLASLALALGLAEVVSAEAGGVRLDTLFVDEGFGSLDRRTLDTAMETLDSLRAGGRTVGLISHVEAMQEDIPAGLHVERLPDGSSTVTSRVPAAV
ncbi:AAA family ATPase [uncultured Amnibacterium sp.]|uniref:AAA family ATPase n=1 Tax=uncultured Amnibacterium sp. TaxID=1631851 RepID=UPI0035CC2A49